MEIDHSFHHSHGLPLILQRVAGVGGGIGQEAGYTLDKLQVHSRAVEMMFFVKLETHHRILHIAEVSVFPHL